MSLTFPLRGAVVGCRMGRGHARALAGLPDFELVALCDINEAQAREVAAQTGDPRVFTDFAAMLAEARPDLVAVATPNHLHAPMTLQAVAAGVRAIVCEKPIAVNMADARAMADACRESGVTLIVNHQRRVGADLTEARRLIEAGAIGKLRLLRGHCGGDILSDGTHLIDSLLWLAGDADVDWVFGQVHRDLSDGKTPHGSDRPGIRYGHPVENGGFGLISLRSGVRIEIFCGDLIESGRHYQDYEAFGTRGRLWRSDDQTRPNLFIEDAAGGPLSAGIDEGHRYKPLPDAEGAAGLWRAVEPPPLPVASALIEGYRRFGETLRTGAPHPMGIDNALRGFEAVMAIYESARLHRKVRPPLQQDRFPLEVMAEEGEI